MHARILKECRALLPMWGVALLLVLAPILVWPVTRDSDALLAFAMFGFGLGAVLLSVTSFGKEFAHGTYGLLLAQPVSRWRLWWEKTLVLGAALGSALLVFAGAVFVSVLVRNPLTGPFANDSAGEVILVGLLLAGAAYGGGLCLTLLLRQANGAFWLALSFPAAVCLGVAGLAHALWGDDAHTGPALIVALIAYSILTYAFGLWLFLKRQDVAWLAGDVTIPLAPAWLVGRAAQAQPGRRFGALRALLSKELHLQQVNLICGVLFVLLFAGAAVAKRSDLKIADVSVQDILLGFLFLIWALMPLLIGAVSIAEERRLGILEWQQSLPVSRSRQFLAKWLPACALSVLLAAVLPWLLEALAYLLTGESVSGLMMRRNVNPVSRLHPVLWFWGVTLGLPALASVAATTVGVFASSLARNLLQALSLVLGLVAATWALVSLFLLAYGPQAQPGPAGLLALVGLPALLLVLGVLAYRNYCEAVPGARLWCRNLIIVGVAYVCVFGATAALYARAWEIFIPEPRISTVHVKGPAAPKITSQFYPFFILLPDGSLWEWKPFTPLGDRPERIGNPGAWRDVASRMLLGKGYNTNETMALKPDGTLWRWLYFSSTNASFRRRTEPAQFGTDRDWKAIAGGLTHYIGLKADGSLWSWGKNDKGQLGDGTTTDREEPVRIGGDTNWAQATAGYGTTLALKTDGSLWEWGNVGPPAGGSFKLGQPDRPGCPSPRRVDQGTNWARAACSSPTGSFAIQTDGSMWRLGDWRSVASGANLAVVLGPTRVGNDSDWIGISGDHNRAVGLKKDGSLACARIGGEARRGEIELWEESFSRRPYRKPWLAIDLDGYDFAVALAADGNLWSWQTVAGEEPRLRLIPPTQRPRLVARLAEPGPLKEN